VDLVECGAAESIVDTNELKTIVDEWVNDSAAYNESAAAAKPTCMRIRAPQKKYWNMFR